ncbi:MAG: class I SAM-dependent RNA methyltransferase, partial [Alphaproteobacteria bacterium]
LQDLLAPLRALLGDLMPHRASADAAATLCDNGIDLTLGLAAEPDLAARERLVEFATAHDLARLSWRAPRAGPEAAPAEPVVARRAPVFDFDGVGVHPPPDGFVQPTRAGEDALRWHVEAALAGAARIADLYAGCGAFGLVLAARGAAVAAFDVAADPIAALLAAARAAGFGERVTAEARDIVRRPLSVEELARFDGVVLDPPRAGADAQARALAGSVVPVVAYVSCNPTSFARDTRTLVDGGYRLVRVTPVDQFLWTAHLELIGVFRR